MVLSMPIDQFLTNKKEEETYKQITKLTINRINCNYTCMVKSFMIFVNEKEINVSKSSCLKSFQQVNSVSEFLARQLPIANVSTPD